MKNNFGFFLPAEVIKAKDEKTGVEKMQIAGIASTTDEDSDEEILLPSGFDLSYLLGSGFVNWHHRQKDKPLAIIGEPSSAQVIDNGKKLKIVCDLYDTPLARDVYELGEILQKQSKTGRRLGFSIEGQALERDKNNPKIVTKAAITGCAITYQPKNKATIAEILKADGTSPDVDLEVDMEGLLEDIALLGDERGAEILKACEYEKSIITEEDEEKDDDKEEEETIDKSLTTESGSVLMPESLEEEQKDARSPFLSKSEIAQILNGSGIEPEEFVKLIKIQKDMLTDITKADIDAALELLEKAKALRTPDAQPDSLEDEDDDKDDADDNEGDGGMDADDKKEIKKSLTSEGAPDDLSKALGAITNSYAEGFGAIGTLFKSLSQELDLIKAQNEEMRNKIEELSNAPAQQRKSLIRTGGAQAIEKSFNSDNIGGNQASGEVLSISRDKGKITSKLEQLAFPISGGINDAFAKAMTVFESSSYIDDFAIQALREKGFEIVK